MIKAIKKLFSRKNNSGINVAMSPSDGLDETFLFDFKNYQSGYRGGENIIGSGTFITFDGSDTESSEDNSLSIKSDKKPKKIAVKPIDVVNELETIPTP
jgi:hypothetical protein